MHIESDIVEVISKYIPLKRLGSSYAGQCPFHPTNTFDAFRVSPRLQIFKCFNCGEKGGVIDFIMKTENIDYKEALRILNVEKLASKKVRTFKKPKPADKNQPILKSAVQYWKFNLHTSKEGLQYLWERGISDENLIDKLNIGFAYKRGLEEHLLSSGYTHEKIEKEGLIKKGKYGIYDFFRERIIFPVYNSSGEIRTITSRAISPEQKIKHLHLPGDIDTFYNENCMDSTYIIIVEGIFDCLSLLQEGFNAIAVYGTGGFKKSMALKLKKTEKIYLSFDKDENQAGQKGLNRALEILQTMKIKNIFTIELPYMERKKIDINGLFSQYGFTKKDFASLIEDAIERNLCVHS